MKRSALHGWLITVAILWTASAYSASFDPTTTFVGVSSATINGSKTQLSISATDVPDNVTIKYGPLTQGITVPANQNLALTYPYRGGMNESATTHTSDKYASGTVGITVAGLVIYGSGNGSTITKNGTSWAYDANQAAINGEDIYGGHCAPNGGGQYHYHDISFIRNNSWVGVSGFSGSNYRQADGHSKLMGWSPDGYPIYGPYGYMTPTNSASGVQLMVSGWTQTNTGANRPSSVTATVASAVNNSTTVIFSSDPGALGLNPGMRITTNSAGLASSTYAILNQANVTYVGGGHPPYTGATNSVTLNSAVTIPAGSSLTFEYLPGLFIEDNVFSNTGTLDQYNGRFCVTPEYPNGTYAYFMTQDSNGKGTYPYMIGPSYYGSLTVGTATKLVFTQQPSNSSPGSSISPAITVAIQTADGTATTSTANVTLALGTNPGGGTITGTTTVSAVNGVATFSNISINNAGNGYTLVATSSTTTGTILATSNTLNIGVTATKLTFGVQPSNAISNTPFSPSVTVQIQDAAGNATTSTASVTLAIGTNPASGTLSGTRTVNAINGTATFTNLSIDKAGVGYTLAATATGLSGATSSAFNITAGTPAQLSYLQQPSIAVSGVAIAPAMTVQILDAAGNLTTSTANVTLVMGNNAGGGVLTGTVTVAAIAGTATFSNLSIDKAATGYTLSASSGGLSGATSSSFTITAGTPVKLAFGIQPSSALSTVAISPAITIQLLDAAGNVATSTANVTISIGNNAGGGTLSGTTTNASIAGTATFTSLSIDKIGTGYTLSVASTGLTGATSQAFNILTGPAANMVANFGSPQSTLINTTFANALQVKVTDAGGNPISGAAVTFTAPSIGASGKFGASLTANANTDSNGFAAASTFTANSIAGNYNVTATSGVLTIPFVLTNTPGPASAITAQSGTPQTALPMAAFALPFSAKVTDAFGNAVPNILVTFAGPSTGASGTFSNNTTITTAMTNNAGIATASTFTSNTAIGTYSITASATGTGTATYSLTNACITLSPSTIPSGVAGKAYLTTTFTTAGGVGTVTLSESGTLPAGMNFSAGNLSGTPSQTGSFPITITASDSTACIASVNFTLLVGAPTVVVAPTTIPSMSVGTVYNQSFTANGGTAPYTYTVPPGALPPGLTLSTAGILAGTPTTEGAYNFSIIATDSTTGSGPYSGSAFFSMKVDYIPVFSSGPSYSPSPALVAQPVAFSVAPLPADAIVTWNFGDGSAQSTLGTHIYTTTGNFTVTATAKNPRSGTSSSVSFPVMINPATAIVGIGPDSDGDGFSDAFETVAGSSSILASSTPTGQSITTNTLQFLTVTAAKIGLNFAQSGKDIITFSGTLAIPDKFNASNAKVYCDVGGVAKALMLDSKGTATAPGDSLKIALKSKNGAIAAQTAKFTATFKNGSFASTLASSNLLDADAPGQSVTVVFMLIFNNNVYQKPQNLTYFAKHGKTGTAK